MDWKQAWSTTTDTTNTALDALAPMCAPFAARWDREAERRAQMDANVLRLAEDVRTEPVDAGGVPAEWISTPIARARIDPQTRSAVTCAPAPQRVEHREYRKLLAQLGAGAR